MAARAALLAVLLSTVCLARATVFLKDHSGEHLVAGASGQQLTAEGLASTISTLAGSTVLTIDAQAAGQVRQAWAAPGRACGQRWRCRRAAPACKWASRSAWLSGAEHCAAGVLAPSQRPLQPAQGCAGCAHCWRRPRWVPPLAGRCPSGSSSRGTRRLERRGLSACAPASFQHPTARAALTASLAHPSRRRERAAGRLGCAQRGALLQQQPRGAAPCDGCCPRCARRLQPGVRGGGSAGGWRAGWLR